MQNHSVAQSSMISQFGGTRGVRESQEKNGSIVSSVEDSEINRIFGAFNAVLRGVLGDSAWRAWGAGLRVGRADDEKVILFAPNITHCDRMLDRVGPRRLTSLWHSVDPQARSIEILADPNPRTGAVAANDTGSTGSDGQGPSVARLRTFGNFVVGDANKSAATAAKVLCEEPDAPFTLLFVHGDQGVGKTHLLTAIEASMVEANPSRKVMFFNAERFRTEYVRAINEKTAIAFKENVSQASVLLIDDLHTIAGSKATEGELFNIITTILSRNGRVVVSGDRVADELMGLDDRLSRRLSSAVTVNLAKPDLPHRRRILERMIEDNPGMRRNQSVPEDVVDFIACAVKDTPRALEAALATVLLQTVMMDRPVNLESAKLALQDTLAVSNRRITVDEIQKTVAEYHGMKVSELLSRSRTHDIVRPRQQAMYLCKVLTSRSLPDIGRRFNDMDHTTVLHAYRRIDKMYGEDARVRNDVDSIRRRLRQAGGRSARAS